MLPRRPIAIAVVQKAGSVLVGVRPEGKPLAGYWEFPGGKVQPGESPAAAAVRECLEETGVAVTVECLLMRLSFGYEHDTVDLHFFLAVPTDREAAPRAGFEWVSIDRLATLRFPPANAPVIERLLARRA